MVSLIKFPISYRDLFLIVKLYSVQSIYFLPVFSFTIKTFPKNFSLQTYICMYMQHCHFKQHQVQLSEGNV